MYKLYVMVGIPASGKSTMINHLKTRLDNPYIYSTDDHIQIFAGLAGKTYSDVFRDKIQDATALADRGLAEAVAAGRDIIWDQTNVAAKKRATILRRVGPDYIKIAWAIRPPQNRTEWQLLKDRLMGRPGKSIPVSVITSMAQQYQEPTVEEGFDAVKVFDIFGKEIE